MFDEFEEEFLKFERIPEGKRKQVSERPDLYAFMLLNVLVPGSGDMVCSAEHDEIWLSVDAEKLKAVATPEQLRDLHRCGVRCDGDSLCMFV